MRKILVIIGAVVGLMHQAFAEPIQGDFNLVGYANYHTDTNTINFLNPGGFGSISGSFATAFPAGMCTDCVTFAPSLDYQGGLPEQIYSATLDGVTTMFNLESVTQVVHDATFFGLAGTGTVTLTGYDAAPAVFQLTSQDGAAGNNTSFSASTIATPEPASLALLGVGLVGLGLVRRRNPAALASEAAPQ